MVKFFFLVAPCGNVPTTANNVTIDNYILHCEYRHLNANYYTVIATVYYDYLLRVSMLRYGRLLVTHALNDGMYVCIGHCLRIFSFELIKFSLPSVCVNLSVFEALAEHQILINFIHKKIFEPLNLRTGQLSHLPYTVLGASLTNLNEPPRALATSTIMWVRS